MNNDTISIILSLLDINDVIKCSLINRRFNKVANSNYLWYNLCNRDYDKYYENLKKETFYETYKLCFDLDNLRLKFRLNDDIGKISMLVR